MASYLRYVTFLGEAFPMFKLVHVPREQNARADLLAKLASSGKGGRQRSVIQETLKSPRTSVDGAAEVRHVEVGSVKRRGHKSLTKETLKVPRISVYGLSGEDSLDLDGAAEVRHVEVGSVKRRGHKSLIKETLKVPRISVYRLSGEDSLDLDDTIPMLSFYRDAPGRACRSEGGQKKCRKIYPDQWNDVPSRLHSSCPHLCKWGSLYPYHGRAP